MSTIDLVVGLLIVGFFCLFVLALMVACGVMGYYLYKFAKIIMVFEDDLGEAIEAADQTDEALNNLLQMPMFFDSPEVKKQVNEALEAVRYLQLRIRQTSLTFTERSKQKYIYVDAEQLDNNINNDVGSEN